MIYVECMPDEKLVKLITNLPEKEISHAGGSKYSGGGRSRVLNKLRKSQGSMGMIDEDPLGTPHPYMKELTKKEDLPECGLKLCYDEHRDNRVIILCPKLEDWILKASEEVGIEIRKYHLPDDPIELHRVINFNLDKFEKLIKDLEACKRSKRLKELKKLLER